MRMLSVLMWCMINFSDCRLKNYLFQTDVRVGNLERCADWKNSANVKGAFKSAYQEVSLPACLPACLSLFWVPWFCSKKNSASMQGASKAACMFCTHEGAAPAIQQTA